MKKLAILPVLAMLATAAACGGKDDDANGGTDTTTVAPVTTDTATMTAPPPPAAMPMDSTGGMTDSTGTGGNPQDTLIKVDSMKKAP